MVIVNLTNTQWRTCRLMYGTPDGAAWRYFDAPQYDDIRDALARAAGLNEAEDGVGGWYVIQQGVAS